MVLDGKGYTGVERRAKKERRLRVDQRSNIRFNESGGDRRSSTCRRNSDICLEILE